MNRPQRWLRFLGRHRFYAVFRLIVLGILLLSTHDGWSRPAASEAVVLLGLCVLAELLLVSRHATVADVVAKSGAPRWMAELLLLEARLGRAAWSFVRLRR